MFLHICHPKNASMLTFNKDNSWLAGSLNTPVVPFCFQNLKNGEGMSSLSPVNNLYLSRSYTSHINQLTHNHIVYISYDIQTKHITQHIEGDKRTCLCSKNRINSYLSYPTCSRTSQTHTHICYEVGNQTNLVIPIPYQVCFQNSRFHLCP